MTTNGQSKLPSHRLTFTSKNGQGKSYTTVIGAGWLREDGSISIQQDFIPNRQGFINLRPIEAAEEAGA